MEPSMYPPTDQPYFYYQGKTRVTILPHPTSVGIDLTRAGRYVDPERLTGLKANGEDLDPFNIVLAEQETLTPEEIRVWDGQGILVPAFLASETIILLLPCFSMKNPAGKKQKEVHAFLRTKSGRITTTPEDGGKEYTVSVTSHRALEALEFLQKLHTTFPDITTFPRFHQLLGGPGVIDRPSTPLT